MSFNLCAFAFAGVCAVNNVLYVVGGDDGSCNLASVEFYNPNTDKWTLLPTCMSTGRSYAGQRPTQWVFFCWFLWSRELYCAEWRTNDSLALRSSTLQSCCFRTYICRRASSEYFLRYTFWPPFAFRSASFLHGIQSTKCLKHSSEILLLIDVTAPHSCCRFVSSTCFLDFDLVLIIFTFTWKDFPFGL